MQIFEKNSKIHGRKLAFKYPIFLFFRSSFPFSIPLIIYNPVYLRRKKTEYDDMKAFIFSE